MTVLLPRYALYFAPHEHSEWARFGARALTGEARRYGFHATLKAPFRLANGARLADLAASLDEWCRTLEAFPMPPLHAARLGDFFALIPATPEARLNAIADDCVRRFEPYRAPLDARERERRLGKPLSDRQRELLDLWGYPHVFDEFRFHLSLTGPLPQERAPGFPPLPDEPLHFDSICIFEEAGPGADFRIAHRSALRRGGRLIYVAGPSGAGKDSVIEWAKKHLPPHARVRFARRAITRPADAGGERHVPLTRGQFEVRRSRGDFAMAWEANGHLYGIGSEIRDWLARGMTVVISGSREYLPTAMRNFPGLEIVHVTAPAPLLRERLDRRGRECPSGVEARLHRAARFGVPPASKELVNDGDVAAAGLQLLAYLEQDAAANL